MFAEIIETITSNIPPSVSKLAILSLSNISANLEVQSQDLELKQMLEKLGLEGRVLKGTTADQSLAIVCQSITVLANMSHLLPIRQDLMRVTERLLASIFEQLNESSNPILLTYLLLFFKNHLCDFFLSNFDQFESSVKLLFTLLAKSSTSGSVFMIAETIFEKMFSVYQEESSDKFNKFLKQMSPMILNSLILSAETQDDQRFFNCLEKFIK